MSYLNDSNHRLVDVIRWIALVATVLIPLVVAEVHL
jgi:hypothetical protein